MQKVKISRLPNFWDEDQLGGEGARPIYLHMGQGEAAESLIVSVPMIRVHIIHMCIMHVCM